MRARGKYLGSEGLGRGQKEARGCLDLSKEI